MKRLLQNDGGVVVRIIMVVVTLIVVSGAIYTLLVINQQNQTTFHRKAQSIAEYGLMTALQKLSIDPQWSEGLPKAKYDDGWYKVTVEKTSDKKAVYLKLRSQGVIGSFSFVKECTLRRPSVSPDSAWSRQSME